MADVLTIYANLPECILLCHLVGLSTPCRHSTKPPREFMIRQQSHDPRD